MIHKAIDHIQMIRQHSLQTLEFVEGTKDNSLEVFLLLMLDRLYSTSKSIELLLSQYSNHSTHELAVGIILRSALLDTIITINLFNVLEEQKGKSEEQLKLELEAAAENYLGDGFDYLVTHLERDQKNGFFSIEELKGTYNNLVNEYSPFFEEYSYDGSKPIVRYKSTKPKALYKTITSSTILKNLSDIITKYEFFSKYDHFTLIQYDMTRQPREDREQRITKSIEHLIFHSMLLHTLIKEVYPEDFFKEQSNLIAKYAEEQILGNK